jgi:hypothetical protein
MALQDRELIATMTALNVANGQAQQQAYNTAMAQYHAAVESYNAQEKAYLGGTEVPGFNPNAPPQPETYLQDVRSGAPVVNNVFYTMPNGQQIPIPNVSRHQPTQPPFDVQQLMKDVQRVQDLRLQNYSDKQIMDFGRTANPPWNEARIKAALSHALPMQGGGF